MNSWLVQLLAIGAAGCLYLVLWLGAFDALAAALAGAAAVLALRGLVEARSRVRLCYRVVRLRAGAEAHVLPRFRLASRHAKLVYRVGSGEAVVALSGRVRDVIAALRVLADLPRLGVALSPVTAGRCASICCVYADSVAAMRRVAQALCETFGVLVDWKGYIGRGDGCELVELAEMPLRDKLRLVKSLARRRRRLVIVEPPPTLLPVLAGLGAVVAVVTTSRRVAAELPACRLQEG